MKSKRVFLRKKPFTNFILTKDVPLEVNLDAVKASWEVPVDVEVHILLTCTNSFYLTIYDETGGTVSPVAFQYVLQPDAFHFNSRPTDPAFCAILPVTTGVIAISWENYCFDLEDNR